MAKSERKAAVPAATREPLEPIVNETTKITGDLARDTSFEKAGHKTITAVGKTSLPTAAKTGIATVAKGALKLGFGGVPSAIALAAGPQASFDYMKERPWISSGETEEQYNARKASGALVKSRASNPGRTAMYTAPGLQNMMGVKNPAYSGQSQMSKMLGVKNTRY